MNDNKQIKNRISIMLEESVDHTILPKGFKRRKNSFIYTRKFPELIQQLDFIVDYYPKYEADADARIIPSFILKIPKVTDEAMRLVEGNKLLLANAPDIILKQPVDFLASKTSYDRWFIKKPSDYSRIGSAICDFIENRLDDLLEHLKTIDDLIHMFESSDERLLKQQHWYLFIAASYSLKDEKNKARNVMEAHFGTPGLRKLYAAAFRNL